MAIALFVMVLLLGGLLVPLRTQVENRSFDNTREMLNEAREALLGYVVAQGYFPCPADTGNGQEAAGSNHGTGACPATVTGTNVYAGFLPAVTLGVTPVDGQGYALDAWSTGSALNRIRYAVANATVGGITNPFTRTDGMRNATMNSIIQSTTLLYVCSTGTGITAAGCASAASELGNNAIAVVWSLGKNAASGGGTAPHEDKNQRAALTSYTRVFIRADLSGAAGSVFDDQLTWIGPALAFNRLIAAGTLP
jgi:hypothetical protein